MKMVRGRKDRALTCQHRTDDCCSPNPKRRPHINHLNGKIADTKKTDSITRFFQIDNKQTTINNTDTIMLDLDYEKLENSIIFNNNNNNNNCDSGLVDKTPTKLNGLIKEISASAPATPHRIELHSDDDVSSTTTTTTTTISEVVIEEQPKVVVKEENRNNNNNNIKKVKDSSHKLTEYFPVRRSVRKTKKIVLEEKQRSLEQILRNQIEEGLEVRVFKEKGRGVVASRPFNKGDFVVEYSGDLIEIAEARRRELKYAQDQTAGCYMYYFKHNDQQYCVDATAETGKLGRLVNHSRNGNLLTRTVFVDNKPRLVLLAKDDIKIGEELTYDYGDRSKESLRHHPWLAN